MNDTTATAAIQSKLNAAGIKGTAQIATVLVNRRTGETARKMVVVTPENAKIVLGSTGPEMLAAVANLANPNRDPLSIVYLAAF